MHKAAKVARNHKPKMWIKYRNSKRYRDLVLMLTVEGSYMPGLRLSSLRTELKLNYKPTVFL